MDRRSQATPMDFEWDNRTGPINPASPFLTAAMNNTIGAAKKRNHSVLDSPTRSGMQNPNLPRLRDPADQTWLFNQPGKPLPAVPSYVSNPALWEPRTPKGVIDNSSGGETPNTPDQGGDSEATPGSGTGTRNKMSKIFGNGGKISPSKSRRESWLGNLFNSSPGRGEGARRDHYSSKAEKRVVKRRQKGLNKQLLKQTLDNEASDSEDDGSSKTKRARGKASKTSKKDGKEDDKATTDTPPAPKGSTIASIFSFIETHPSLPHVLSYYAQLLLNFFLVFSAIYILYSFWHAITNEVDIYAKDAAAEMMAEIAICAQNYRENRCERATRVPAMETVCSNWEACMQRDPKKVARASVSAKTFAIIFNNFVENISYKTMLFTALLLFGCFFVSNYAFGIFRNKATHMPPPHPYSHDAFMQPPATPQRYPSGGFLDQQGYYTPYATLNGHPSQAQFGLEPAPSQGLNGIGGEGAVKKLMFR
ncbi:hypothetical protein K432DRAFT_316615 [Lepidopterella palustris CBS 459.81]|uniref:Brl1/Brr6 domain-containing protein n=1 Tax=Lepidopterella palustris CBS 459.81 TaxID=1314670 RepID=A0A8E2EM73_9PEZI|nr:hypothetical protein K432DRAFT_316615 [Lepidopterella palustris CBS 459.81]